MIILVYGWLLCGLVAGFKRIDKKLVKDVQNEFEGNLNEKMVYLILLLPLIIGGIFSLIFIFARDIRILILKK
jgi:hypothetical protein